MNDYLKLLGRLVDASVQQRINRSSYAQKATNFLTSFTVINILIINASDEVQ